MPHTPIRRRTFLLGALAGGALAACGGSDGDDSGDADGDDAGDADAAAAAGTAGAFTLVQRFPQGLQVPGAQRLPISLSTGAAELIQDGPDTLRATVVDPDGNAIGEPVTAARRDVEPAPYYDFHTTIGDPGFFSLVVDGGPEGGAGFQVRVAEEVPVPVPGAALPPFDTPTVEDARGIDPICTRTPDPCPFHDVTLTAALGLGTVVAYYVGTPAFCSTGSCGPALESMIELQEEFAETVTFVHAEVYTDTTATEIAPAVDAIGMTYEPALFVADASGTVVDRLDAVWNTDELRETLERAVS